MAYQPLPADAYPVLDILVAIGTAIKTNAAIADWCLTNYGREISVFAGSDQDDPPVAEDQYPAVEIFPLTGDDSTVSPAHDRGVFFTIGLHDKEKKPTEYQGLYFQRGLLNIELLYALILNAVLPLNLGDGYIDRVIANRDPKASFPLFFIEVTLLIKKPRWPYEV